MAASGENSIKILRGAVMWVYVCFVLLALLQVFIVAAGSEEDVEAIADEFDGLEGADEELLEKMKAGGMDMGEMDGMPDMGSIDPAMMEQMMGGGMGGMPDMEGMDPAMMAQMMGGGMGGMPGMEGMDPAMMAQMMGGGMGGMGMGGGAEAVISDVKYIMCPACKALVRRAKKTVDDLRSSLPNTKISEDRIDELVENICDPQTDSGSWLAQYEIVEEELTPKTYLDLKRMAKPGPCLEDCMTVAAACERIMSEAGPDLVEKLWANKMDKSALTEFVCEKVTKKMKGSCGRKRLKIPESRKKSSKSDGMPKLENLDPLDMDEINKKIRENPDLASTSKEEL